MIEVHPSYIQKEGRTEFVVLPVEEYQSLREHMEDLEDLLDLRNAKAEEGGAPCVKLEQVKLRDD